MDDCHGIYIHQALHVQCVVVSSYFCTLGHTSQLHIKTNYHDYNSRTCVLGLLDWTIHTDIDECEFPDMNECHEAAICTNTEGSYNCSCKEGYDGDGYNCTGIRSTTYTYMCTDSQSECYFQYFYVYLKSHLRRYLYSMFLDRDECMMENDCHTHADCINTEGSYDCTCRSGFTGNGTDCNGMT